jgi:hypothetical protein
MREEASIMSAEPDEAAASERSIRLFLCGDVMLVF